MISENQLKRSKLKLIEALLGVLLKTDLQIELRHTGYKEVVLNLLVAKSTILTNKFLGIFVLVILTMTLHLVSTHHTYHSVYQSTEHTFLYDKIG